MRLRINKKLKIGLMCLFICIVAASSFLLYRTINYPGTKEEKVTLYSYTHKPDIKYVVTLKPNVLYKQQSFGEEQTYIAEFTDQIKGTFSYLFEGEEVAEIKGNYEILAIIEGYIGEGEKEIVIWSKEIPMLTQTSFETKEKSLSIVKDFSINYAEYKSFVEEFTKTSKVNTKTRIRIPMNINLKADTGKGVVEEKLIPTMVIPLDTSYFRIGEENVEEKPGTLEETNEVQLPINKKIVTLYSIILGIFFIGLLYLIFFTSQYSEQSPRGKALNRIFKNHGSRLVALDMVLDTMENKQIQVKSIDDLVRVADEVERPIMYIYSEDYEEISEFYVMEEHFIYVFNLKEALIREKIDAYYKDYDKLADNPQD